MIQIKKNFFDSWNYLNNHYIFTDFSRTFSSKDLYFATPKLQECLDISVQKVDPFSNKISNSNAINTKVEVWIEAGPYIKDKRTHDLDLDCGGNTFEEVIIELAELVYQKYGDNHIIARKIVEKQYNE